MQPNYPLYIVSKGRWDQRMTMKVLDRMLVRYHVVVEEQEADQYRAALNPDNATVLILDPNYKSTYPTHDPKGDANGLGTGSGPARNFAWDHALSNGHGRYWVIDDNIYSFYRLNRNQRIRVFDGSFFRAMEDFVDRYTNIAMAGPQYHNFAPARDLRAPFVSNTRIYSCNLIDTSLSFRFRGRYNEDTILSLDMLKAGYCTVLFNAFLQNKMVTQRMRGGNTDEIYRDGTLEKSQLLVQEHPDVSRVVWKFNRWHHHVDYRPFKHNQLKRRTDIEIPTGVNEYGMKLVRLQSRTEG